MFCGCARALGGFSPLLHLSPPNPLLHFPHRLSLTAHTFPSRIEARCPHARLCTSPYGGPWRWKHQGRRSVPSPQLTRFVFSARSTTRPCLPRADLCLPVALSPPNIYLLLQCINRDCARREISRADGGEPDHPRSPGAWLGGRASDFRTSDRTQTDELRLRQVVLVRRPQGRTKLLFAADAVRRSRKGVAGPRLCGI